MNKHATHTYLLSASYLYIDYIYMYIQINSEGILNDPFKYEDAVDSVNSELNAKYNAGGF